MNMLKWKQNIIETRVKKAVPVLTFPSVQIMGITVNELISDPAKQAEGMALIAERCDIGAALSMMDLSVEAETFGSTIRFSDDEVPTVLGHIIETEEEADKLRVPQIGEGRTGLYIEGVRKAKEIITDRPVLAGVIGPFSLAARLMGVSEAMMNCYEEPDMVETILEKAVEFSTAYIKAYKEIGADGVVMAEPAAGLLSPALMEEFATPYVKRIIDAVQSEDFAVVYHNCGGSVIRCKDQIASLGAYAYHFGNSIVLKDMFEGMPADALIMGNVDPAGTLCNGTKEKVIEDTLAVLNDCSVYTNFVPSSGCDIPPITPWENIDAFLETVRNFY